MTTQVFQDTLSRVIIKPARHRISINNWRLMSQYLILAVLLILPLMGWIRLDTMALGDTFELTSLKLHFFGSSIWLDEFFLVNLGLLWFTAFIAFLSVTLGRVFCGWGCPQTVFSELTVNGSKGNSGFRLLIVTGISLYIATNSLLYFVDLSYLKNGLWQPSQHPVVFWSFWITAAVFFMDFFIYRHAFCNGFCPYGWLQSLLQSESALVVRFDKGSAGKCLDCNQCVNACYMGIDIKDGSLQMACQKCGKCIDACYRSTEKRHLRKFLRFSLENSRGQSGSIWNFRSGTLTVVLIGLTALLGYRVINREPIHLIVSRDGLYGSHRRSADQTNAFIITVTGRDNFSHDLQVYVSGVKGIRLLKKNAYIPVSNGQRARIKLFTAAPRENLQIGVNRIYFTVMDRNNPKIRATRKASFIYDFFEEKEEHNV